MHPFESTKDLIDKVLVVLSCQDLARLDDLVEIGLHERLDNVSVRGLNRVSSSPKVTFTIL